MRERGTVVFIIVVLKEMVGTQKPSNLWCHPVPLLRVRIHCSKKEALLHCLPFPDLLHQGNETMLTDPTENDVVLIQIRVSLDGNTLRQLPQNLQLSCFSRSVSKKYIGLLEIGNS